MASQSSDELCTAMLGPSADAEPATWVPSRASPHPNVDSRESSEKQGDQAESPDPGSQDNPPPQGADYGVANQSILQLSLPRKLWRMVEDPAFTSVRWNDKGDMVIIKEDLFQREVLHRRGADRIFNTDSLTTFIRQMNRYGFSKICLTSHSPGKKRLMIFCNSNFQRDKPLLIENIQRECKLGATDQPGTSATAPEGKKPHVLYERWSAMGQGTPSPQELPASPTLYPAYGSAMSLYNSCLSLLLRALLATSPNKVPEVDEE
ncbi:heat shock transcription factor, X-linked member 4 [Phocoena phocoena]|uniref:heat shock transcription factor, X-linked member 4 n=1 Tax=Phocoena phocoena TaxID=9742 RepID=UPI00330776D6